MDELGICDCGLSADEHIDLHFGQNCELLDYYNRGWETLRRIDAYNAISSEAITTISVSRNGREFETIRMMQDDPDAIVAEASRVVSQAKAQQGGVVIADPETECWKCASPADEHVAGPMGSDCLLGAVLYEIDDFLNSVDDKLSEMGLSRVAWTHSGAEPKWDGDQLEVTFSTLVPSAIG